MNPCVAMDYIESCLKIKTKSGTVVPFRLNDAQRKLYAVAKRQQDAGKPVRLIILKARQLGFSTLTEGLIFHACATRKNVNALIVAHREDATANLFRMSKLFYDELPAPVKPMLRASNAQELVFENPSKLRSEREARPGLRSRIRCATAGEGSDYFTAIVIDNVSGRITAKLRQKYSEPEYVRQIYALGRFYNDALVAIETNFSTYPVMKLQEMEYPNQYSREREDTYTRQMKKSYGFRTDRQSRPRAIANLVEVFSSHPEWFTDRELLEEMLTFCYNEDHRPEALAGKHDDLVMGAAITYAVRHQQRMTVLTEPEKPREKLIDQMKRQKRARKAW